MTQTDHIAQFLTYLQTEKRFSDHTLLAYEKELERWSDYLASEAEISLFQATLQHAKRFVIWRSKQGITPRSVNRMLSTLRSFYKWGIREGLISQSPVEHVRSLKTPKKVVMSVPREDLNALFSDAGRFEDDFVGTRDQLMLLLLYGLGLRKSELISLQPADFDWSRQTVRVIGKRNKERQIPIPKSISSYFDLYMKRRAIWPLQRILNFYWPPRAKSSIHNLFITGFYSTLKEPQRWWTKILIRYAIRMPRIS